MDFNNYSLIYFLLNSVISLTWFVNFVSRIRLITERSLLLVGMQISPQGGPEGLCASCMSDDEDLISVSA